MRIWRQKISFDTTENELPLGWVRGPPYEKSVFFGPKIRTYLFCSAHINILAAWGANRWVLPKRVIEEKTERWRTGGTGKREANRRPAAQRFDPPR